MGLYALKSENRPHKVLLETSPCANNQEMYKTFSKLKIPESWYQDGSGVFCVNLIAFSIVFLTMKIHMFILEMFN